MIKCRIRERRAAVADRVRAAAQANNALVAVEPIIDNEVLVIDAHAWPLVLSTLRASPPDDPKAAGLTTADAQQAVLARLAAAGGRLPPDEAFDDRLEAESFPLDYRGRDAITDLVGAGELEVIRRRGTPPLFALTPAGQRRLRDIQG